MTVKTAEMLVEEIEYLASKLESLREAEDLSEAVNASMYRDLVRLHRQALKQIKALVRRILKGRIALGAGPKVSLEHLERMFIVLRNQAEQAYARAVKFSGKRAKVASAEAGEFARWARHTAQLLRASAEHRGIWNDAYIAEHGLGPWVR